MSKGFEKYLSMVFENHKKVSFHIASEASYVYILIGQKLVKSAKNGQFWWVFGQTVLSDRSSLVGQKLVENPKIKNSTATFWVIFKHCGDEFNVPKKFFWKENLLIFKLFDLLVTNIFPYFGSWLTPNMTAEVSVLLIAAVPVCQTLWLASIHRASIFC